MKKLIPLNEAFKDVNNSYDVIYKIKHCQKQGIEAVYITRYNFMTLKKFMFLVVRLSEIGYHLQEIKQLIKDNGYEELI